MQNVTAGYIFRCTLALFERIPHLQSECGHQSASYWGVTPPLQSDYWGGLMPPYFTPVVPILQHSRH